MRITSGLFIILLVLLMGYSASHYKAPEIQADIDYRTKTYIASIDTASKIIVETDGRHVTLRGLAASEAEKKALIARAKEVWGGFAPIDEIEVLRVAKPYELSVVKGENGHIILSGVAPSEAVRNWLLFKAEGIFGDDVESNLTLAAGVPKGDWVAAVLAGMDGLALLDHGRLDVADDRVELAGEAERSDIVDRLDELKAKIVLPGFTRSDAIDIAKPTISPFTFMVKKASDAWQVRGYAPDEETRGQLLAKIQAAAGDNEIKGDIQLAQGVPGSDWPDRAAAAIEALAKLETGELSIQDRDVRLSGDALSRSALETVETLVSKAPGGADWQADLGVLRPTISPYKVEIDKSDDGGWSIAGTVPDEASRDALIRALKETAEGQQVAIDLQLADGAPGVDWQGFLQERLAALKSVDAGTLRFEDYDVRLDGRVLTMDAIEEAKAEIAAIDPEITLELEALDPTVEAFFDLRVTPDDGVTMIGALPKGLSEKEVIALLGLQAGHNGELTEQGKGDAEVWRSDLKLLGSYLPEFERVELSLADGLAAIDGETHAKTDVEQVAKKLKDALKDRWHPELAIDSTERRYRDGARRANPLSGAEEEYRRGFWLPVASIIAGLDACRKSTSETLTSNKITFLAGEAQLDARARRIINDLSSVALGCLDEGIGLHLEIGGHSDSRGADDMNSRLSQARADAVLRSLIARGVAANAMSARGYGESEPIADNASEEGRSANRRISFKWLNEPKADG